MAPTAAAPIMRPMSDPLLQRLGPLGVARFLREHWQRKPLMVRGALPGLAPPANRRRLFQLAARDDVESRLVWREGRRWRLRHGPFPRGALPPPTQPRWTLLVQGLDLVDEAAHALLARFRFVPDARLDDVMASYATDGGGVGPHVDNYDVFLLQVQGRRRWRISRQRGLPLRPGAPLKLLAGFRATQEWILEPGDLLYLPPGWAHDGVAEGGECMTASIGYRAPAAGELARELLARIGEDAAEVDRLYADPAQPATAHPGALPPALVDFARAALTRALREPYALERALGEWLTEPKPRVWFEAGGAGSAARGVRLDPKSRMLYDRRHVFINGESFVAGGRDATLIRRLADRRALGAAERARLGPAARAAIDEWLASGWVHEEG